MKLIILTVLCFFHATFFAQSRREEIIIKGIKSITRSYWKSDSSQKIEIKNYYSINGDDSIEYYCGKLSFRFEAFFSKDGRVEHLERHDAVDRIDEWHMYKYAKNGTYSIEVVAHGAGTILFSEYDRNHKCLKEEFSGVESLYYKYDNLGKLSKILYGEKKEKPKEIAAVIYNKEGLIEKIIGTEKSSQIQYFKYNASGLVSEKISVMKKEKGEEEKQIIYYEYEFR